MGLADYLATHQLNSLSRHVSHFSKVALEYNVILPNESLRSCWLKITWSGHHCHTLSGCRPVLASEFHEFFSSESGLFHFLWSSLLATAC